MFFTCPVCAQGKYCPTTCGVADYMLRYMPGVDKDLDDLQRELEIIANLTQGAEDTVVYMKDSVTSAQKSSPQGNTLSSVPSSYSLLINVIRWFSLLLLFT